MPDYFVLSRCLPLLCYAGFKRLRSFRKCMGSLEIRDGEIKGYCRILLTIAFSKHPVFSAGPLSIILIVNFGKRRTPFQKKHSANS